MTNSKTAKLFRNGRSQAVRLPREFRFDGDAVRIRRVPEGVLLEALTQNPREWFASMDEAKAGPLLPKGRKQARAPRRKIFS